MPAGARPWDGLQVLVTAGGTREPIDACATSATARSGRMGFALAEEAAALRRRGDRASRPTSRCRATARALRRRRDRAPSCGTPARREFAGCRRAADGRRRRRLPARAAPRDGKLKKDGARRRSTLELEPTTDVLAAWPRAAARARCWSASPPSTATGAVAYGRDKLERKGLDAVVVNDISRPDIGFDADRERGHDRHRRRRARRPARRPRPRSRARSSTRSSALRSERHEVQRRWSR